MSTVRPTAYRLRARLERPGTGVRMAILLVVAAAVFVEAFLLARASSVSQVGPPVAPYRLPDAVIPTALTSAPEISALRVVPRRARPAAAATASPRPAAAVRAPSSSGTPPRAATPPPAVRPAPAPTVTSTPTAAPPPQAPPARSPAPRPAPSSGGGGSGGSGGTFFQSG